MSESESFLDLGENLDDVPELVCLEADEYELRCSGAEIKTYSNEKGEGAFISMSFDVPAEPNSKGIYHTLFLPKADDDEKKKNAALRRLKVACQAMGVEQDGTGINVNDFVGETCFAILKVESSDEYGDQNKIARFVLPG